MVVSCAPTERRPHRCLFCNRSDLHLPTYGLPQKVGQTIKLGYISIISTGHQISLLLAMQLVVNWPLDYCTLMPLGPILAERNP